MPSLTRVLLTGLLAICLAGAVRAELPTLELTVTGGEVALTDALVRAPFTLQASVAALIRSAVVELADGTRLPAQVASNGFLGSELPMVKGEGSYEVFCFLPELPAGATVTGRVLLSEQPPAADVAQFAWRPNAEGSATDLLYGDQTVGQFVHPALDETSPRQRERTYKPYFMVHDPADGQRVLTKGPGGQFTHHRGIFFGYNRISYGELKDVDVWHCKGKAHQRFSRLEGVTAGPLMARHVAYIDWVGTDGEAFIDERRELTVFWRPEGLLIEFCSRLETPHAEVKLDGDPQHAGVHFRASNLVSESTKAQTYYLRPDGPGAPGATRNWPGQRDHMNLPWYAMSFVVDGQRYTTLRVPSPINPGEERLSERDYGRFGGYIPCTLEQHRPLKFGYRFWVQRGELTVAQAAGRAADFRQPVAASITPLR